MYTQKKLSGFTIVELLIVIVVIAILAAITIVAYNGIQQRARDSAQKAAITQAEQAITVYALQTSGETINIGGSLIGYQEGAGQATLITPLVGTPDITMYMVCSVVSTAANYQVIAWLTPRVFSTHAFLFQTSATGSSSMGYRIDTPAQSNAASGGTSTRVPGNTVVGWLQVSNGATVRSFNYNNAAASTLALNPGAGWNFTGVEMIGNSSCTPKAALVFNTAQDQTTRQQVIGWLAEKYGISL